MSDGTLILTRLSFQREECPFLFLTHSAYENYGVVVVPYHIIGNVFGILGYFGMILYDAKSHLEKRGELPASNNF